MTDLNAAVGRLLGVAGSAVEAAQFARADDVANAVASATVASSLCGKAIAALGAPELVEWSRKALEPRIDDDDIQGVIGAIFGPFDTDVHPTERLRAELADFLARKTGVPHA